MTFERLTPETLSELRQKSASNFDDQVNFLQSLVSFDSGTGNVEGNKKVIEVIFKALDQMPEGLVFSTQIESAPDVGDHLIVRLGDPKASRKFLALAHLDTVFAPGQAALHPFGRQGDKFSGLGVADCKGGVVVSLFGAKLASQMGLFPKDTELTLLYTSDEETGSLTAKPIYERESICADLAFVFEPARGINGIITDRKGCAFGTIEVTGRQAHGLSAYQSGADANLTLAKAIDRLCQNNDANLGRFFNFGLIFGGCHADIVSDHAKADFFVNFHDLQELDLISAAVRALETTDFGAGCTIATTLTTSFPPLNSTPASLEAYEKVKQIGIILGLELPRQSSPGSSDGCFLSSYGVPVLDALGPYMYDIHTTSEMVGCESIREKTLLFSCILACLDEFPSRAEKKKK
ncbi:MAG: M20/M25/M40 family metallo-hydrolase [Deltaproteobacteria bacterium]|jgi:glutamate carboxypeptidase|nr:M20/M25/M40 family metallo-hydrolase [Deltaproteobacteria bacterium]